MVKLATTLRCSPYDFMISATHNASLSEGGARAVVVRDFPESSHQTRDNTESPRRLRPSEARLGLACRPRVRRNGAPCEGGQRGRCRNA